MMENTFAQPLPPPRPGMAVIAGALLGAVLAGCNGRPTPPPLSDKAATETYVQQRAEARWKALEANRLDEAYGYNTPGSRGLMSLEQFKALYEKRAWSAPEITRVECTEDRCTVSLSVLFQPPQGGSGPASPSPMKGEGQPPAAHSYRAGITEDWIFTRGEWWRVEKK